MVYARITGTGGYLPENVVTNKDLEKIVETSDQWIRERTGIEQRHIARDDETTVDLAEKASRMAIEAAGIDPSEIDLIVLATSTPDKIFPSSACILQARLDIHGCPAFDIQAVCTGFVYALTVAEKFIKTGSAKKALVVGAEVFSRILNWQDRKTCVLFGDGAGAVILEASRETGILSTHIHADGQYEDLLLVPHGISDGFEQVKEGKAFVEMRGNEVFKSGSQPHDEIRYRLAGTAPGEHPHYFSDCQEAENVDGPGSGYGQQARQYIGRFGPAGAERGGTRRSYQEK
jgi:3-oxoacyl-[acyl-carrier-protein] synthase-3